MEPMPTLSSSKMKSRGFTQWIIFTATVLLLFFALLHTNVFSSLHHASNSLLLQSHIKLNGASPRDIKVIGLVPVGRRDRLSILDCYLRRNLVVNGGQLDEVHFVLNTENEDDISWMKENLLDQEGYVLPDLEHTSTFSKDWSLLYNNLERNTLYLKIDDDIVYIADGAIEAMLETKLNHPELAIVSGNVVNHAILSWVHYHYGASRVYLPELEPPAVSPSKTSWRASELPEWKGPESFRITEGENLEPPFENHRWLPVQRKYDNFDGTPMAISEYDPLGRSWKRWDIAAQEHYSLLENLESDPSLRCYDFGLWHSYHKRFSIHFILFLSNDVLDNGPVTKDDEHWFTTVFTKKIKRHIGVPGKAVVAHFDYGSQRQLSSTDLLSRYKAYADEKICHRN